MRTITHYHEHPGYIRALAATAAVLAVVLSGGTCHEPPEPALHSDWVASRVSPDGDPLALSGATLFMAPGGPNWPAAPSVEGHEIPCDRFADGGRRVRPSQTGGPVIDW